MTEFQVLPAVRLEVVTPVIPAVPVQIPGAYIVLPGAGELSTFPGSADYEAASVNETLTALIERKLERNAVTGIRNLVLFFENKLA